MKNTLFAVAAWAPPLLVAVTALSLHAAEPSAVSPAPAPAAVLEPLPEAPPLTESARKLLDTVNQRIHNIDTAGLLAQLKDRPDTLVIDVRTPAELTLLGGRIDAPRFLNIARGWLEFQLEGYVTDKDAPIVVYCGVNQRSPLAADTLMKLGYTNVKNFSDGFFKWKQAGLPIQQNDKVPASFLYDLPQEVIPGQQSAPPRPAPTTIRATTTIFPSSSPRAGWWW